ncbi:hypothetical protein [Polyangium jinanense]|uniref:Uncharacterized protein n=1 Tax=Polyangium jinanense TaxID=2829994 RepID=A0A9X4AQE7_9BACT|nr:hypothetical protein [Polyangium jinanense]MDC3979010.1 hypothetical protein [Polyangium jinanense]
MKEKLAITLTLKVGGTEHTIPGGNVRGFSLRMEAWGVSGSVEFVMQDDSSWGGKYTDDLLADFVKADLGEVSLSIKPGHLETDTEADDAEIKTSGLVLEKSVREETTQRVMDEPAVLFRHYRVTFVDPAQALWRQHFPCALYTETTFKDVIEAHKGDKISLTYDWDVITTTVSQIFFHLDPAARSSFYDLVIWYVRHRNGVFTYDHAEGTYSIKGAKDTSGEASELLLDDLSSMTSFFPEVPRYKPRVLNSYTESTATQLVDNTNAATGMYRDTLLRTPIAQDVDDRVTLETARPLLPKREVELSFRRFPTVAVSPGSLLDISTTGGHSSNLIAATESFRVVFLSLEARASGAGPEPTYGDTAASFSVDCTARLEEKSEPRVRLPSIVDPRFPGHLEGKIVSAVGADTDITYDFATDDDTSIDQYTVKIPLFESKEISAPYEPESGAGNLYLPLYKNQRVLVALDFSKATVIRMIDWRSEARVAKDGQGQHLFLGKTSTNNTSVLHDYQDEKPVLRVLRTNDKDTVLLRLEEGKMTLKVEETGG